MTYKYLRVVNDNTNKIDLVNKKSYKVISLNYDEHNRSLIEPLHGTTPELAAQYYLYEHPREFMVNVRIALPEFKYEKYNDILVSRNPAILKKIASDLSELEEN